MLAISLISFFVSGHFNVEAIAFSLDSSLLVSGGWDDLTVWDVRSDRRLATFQEEKAWIRALAFSPDSQMLVGGDMDGKLQVWNVATAVHFATFTEHTEAINVITFSPDGRTLASWSADGTILLWDWNKIRSKQ